MRRLLALTATAALVPAAPASAGVLDAVTGILAPVTQTVTQTAGQTLDQVLAGATGPLAALPESTLAQLLGPAPAPGPAPGAAAGVAGGGDASGAAQSGSTVVDAAAPTASTTVRSRLSQIGRTGSLRLRVRLDEPGVVALSGAVRPGNRRKGSKARSHSRKLIKIPVTVLAFRRAGTAEVTIRLSRAARRTLGRSRDGRMSLALVTADVARNQATSRARRQLRR